MRKPAFLLWFLLATAPALAQDAAGGPQRAATGADAAAAGDQAADSAVQDPVDPADAPRSGFGQVMSVLTGLLQDAAQREATGRGDGFALDNPAIEISVTPIAGQTSFLRPAGGDGTRRADGDRQLAGGTPR